MRTDIIWLQAGTRHNNTNVQNRFLEESSSKRTEFRERRVGRIDKGTGNGTKSFFMHEKELRFPLFLGENKITNQNSSYNGNVSVLKIRFYKALASNV